MVVDWQLLRGLNSELTRVLTVSTFRMREIYLSPGLQAKLARLAVEYGRDMEVLVQEAVEQFVGYDEWFLREVKKGLEAADRGGFIEHEEIGKLIGRRCPG